MSGRESEQFWKTVTDTMMDGLLIVDPEGIILAANLAMEEITGYRREELIGQPCTILKCHTCLDALTQGRRKECELFKRGAVRHRKCTLEKKDGSQLHVLKNAAVLLDRPGKVVAGVENFTDLSEVVAKERGISYLRRELSREDQARSLPEKSPDMMQLFISHLHREISREDGFHGIIGKPPVMLQLFTLISAAAQSEAPVIIYGESGTGKELVALFQEKPQPPQVLLDVLATEAKLRQSNLGQYHYLFFGTHGFLADKMSGVAEPTLVLTQVKNKSPDDGFLSFSRRPGSPGRHPTSAATPCMTGVGQVMQGEGVLNFARAFQQAGARSVMVALWNIPVEESMKFYSALYKALKEGKPRIEALKVARQAVRAKEPHPYFWAGLILHGEG